MANELTENFGLLVSKEMMDSLRKVHYEQRNKYTSIADFVRQAIEEKLKKEE